MADEQNDSKLINRKNAGFPEWLDFDKLRREGIDYIGKLSGKIWTDHNVHDPGITTLEVLCYALLDLGYRTNLPAKDIFARDPEDKNSDDNFFTPAEILTNNPLTIIDYRKLLIDIPGIKNAWLEVATDQHADDLCKEDPPPSPSSTILLRAAVSHPPTPAEEKCCISYLNGLYHVYIDTEKNLDDEFSNDAEKKKRYVQCLIEKVKMALMTHRNICEDFVDVKILCKWKVGVCAEIELEEDADPEKVYLEMIEKLRQFFSPSPRFYTLPQMLEKNRTIDEIFGGRPYDIKESHGFIDTEELESLELRKTIHVSDVYNELFSVKGLRKVQRLRLINCRDSKKFTHEWIVKIPEDNVPDFDFACSGFEFNRNGIPVSFDFKKFDSLLEINFEHNGKILYQAGSDKLDTEIPKGIYHKDLGSYSSIQNEFPRVYGIAEGGLPDTAPDLRKAQARQFKGYLLFFDHLLASYVSQLKHIRSLFPLRLPASDSKKLKATYFSSVPGNVPDFQQLITYKIDETSDGPAGEAGFLAFPVSKSYFQNLLDHQKHKTVHIEKLPYFRFSSTTEKNIAVAQLQDDMLSDNLQINFVTKQDDCVYYYVVSSSNDFILVSRKYYKDEKAAMVAAASIKYAGTVSTNYRTSISEVTDGFSFSVELNVTGYAEFLQRLTENDSLYHQRKQAFLGHLLSRFAEKFTDYGLLSYSFYSQEELQINDVLAKAFYLSNYPLLSSNRGKAFDYTTDGWYTENNSGFEKKIRALLGHDKLKRKTLCNFDVYDYGEKYIFQFKLSEGLLIKTNEKFATRENAKNAAHQLFQALSLQSSYHTSKIAYQEERRVVISYGQNKEAHFTTIFPSQHTADMAAGYLYRLIAIPQANGKVEVLSYRYSILMLDENEKIIRTFSETFNSGKEAINTAVKSINELNSWKTTEKATGKLLVNPLNRDTILLIDDSLFKTDIDNNIIGKPNLFNYELLDKENHFSFRSTREFDNSKKAREECNHAKRLLSHKDNLKVEQVKDEKNWVVYIAEGDRFLARCSTTAYSKYEAEQLKENIWDVIKPFVYSLKSVATPDTWKFRYALGFEPGKTVFVDSPQVYDNKQEAESGLVDFSHTISKSHIEKHGGKWQVIYESGKDEEKIILGILSAANDEEHEIAEHWVHALKEIRQIRDSEPDEEAFSRHVEVHEDNQCRFVYHLADKDGLYAIYKKSFAGKAETKNALANEFIKDANEYEFLELQMGGHVKEYIGTATHSKWYHYQLRTSNAIPKPQGGQAQKLVLFESVHGYLSKEGAEKAFVENFLEILSLASDFNNYGENKPISESQVFIREKDSCINMDLIAYVPKETLDFLGTYPQQAIEELINIVLHYPIRILRKKKQLAEFNDRFFPCEKMQNEQEKECEKYFGSNKVTHECSSQKEIPVYYFALYKKAVKAYDNKQIQTEDWQSVNYFDSYPEAMKAFRFFLLLLNYEGNYTANIDCAGNFRIYIREVLAESNNRFYDERHAWGQDGVQKFIQVSQERYSFHAWVDENCCHRFFVACKNNRVFHPCKYDSHEIRDKAIKQLQHYLPPLLEWKLQFCDQSWEYILYDFHEQKICKVDIRKGTWLPTTKLDAYIELFRLIGTHSLCIDEKENVIRLDNGNGLVIEFSLHVASIIQDVKDLKDKLLWLACYFPFIKKEKKDQRSYCIEIRLPGFNNCDHCNDEENEFCSVAWTSECCYENCKELLNAYTKIISWLNKFEFYKPVFDCPCGAYGIELYDDSTECIGYSQLSPVPDFSLAKIIAHSPQCYPSAEMVCEAIDRAKRLINSEGLHLVEHILLRPHCIEDCACRIKPCADRERPFYNCEFPDWKVDNDDPCDETEPVCFEPGSDPYSFIATVILPAWPERFRKKENILLLENMFYREVPAHVALRILWLTPHDLYCFEDHFRHWLMWNAYLKTRTDQFAPCDLVNFLFNREFECWKDNEHCVDCKHETAEPISCVQEIKREEKNTKTKTLNGNCPDTWLEQITGLYCWSGKNCDETYYTPCDAVKEKEHAPTVEIIERATLADKPLPVIETGVKKKGKDQLLNSRRSSRKKMIESIVTSSKQNELAIKTNRFLESGAPAATSFNKLIAALVEMPEKKKMKAGKEEPGIRQELIKAAVHFYIDKKAFGEEDPDFTDVQSSFDLLKGKGINAEKIYHQWEPDTVKEYLPAARLKKVQKLFKK